MHKSSEAEKLHDALDKAQIGLPYEIQVQLFHYQTESTDGDRGLQRKGWPVPEQGGTQPRWKAQAERQDKPDANLNQ